MGVAEWPIALIAAEDVASCKPDPEGYLLTLDALRSNVGLNLEAGHCLVFEDSLAGIEAGKAAGMWCVGVSHTYPADQLRRRRGRRLGRSHRSRAGLGRMFFPSGNLAMIELIDEPIPNASASPSSNVGLLICRDLFFVSKVTGTAEALGRKILTAGDRASALVRLETDHPVVVFLNLHAGDATDPEAIRGYRVSAPSAILIGFGSHVETALLSQASAAGCDSVLPRSAFSNRLPAIIQEHLK